MWNLGSLATLSAMAVAGDGTRHLSILHSEQPNLAKKEREKKRRHTHTYVQIPISLSHRSALLHVGPV